LATLSPRKIFFSKKKNPKPSLKTGADLAHVFCTRGAAPIIKAYSPDLIVHPLLRESVDRNSSGENDGEEKRAAAGTKATTSSSSPSSSSALAALSVSDIEPWLPRFDSLVVGPGLGSDPAIEEAALTLMTRARELGIALLLDADALKLVSRDPGSVRGYRGAVVTPNAVEFERMARSLGLVEKEKDNEEKEKGSASSSLRFDAAAFAGGPSSSSSSSSSLPDSPLDSVAALALALDGPVVIRKGAGDCMAVAVSSSSRSDSGGGEEEEEQKGSKNQPSSPPPPPPPPLIFSACCSHGGSPRRAGGQGDLTSGSVAAFLAWACSRRLAAGGGGGGGGGGGNDEEEEKKGSKLHSPPAALAAAFGGCSLVRGAAAAAFARRRRAALASDVLDAIEGAEEAAPPRGFDV